MEARSVLWMQPASEQECIANEISQCKVRLFVVLFLSGLLLKSGHTTHPLFIFVILYTITFLIISITTQSYSPVRYITAILVDTACSIGGLYIVGTDAAILFVVLVQVAFGAGVRYGLSYLNFAVVYIEATLLGLFAVSPYWQANAEWIFVFFIAIPFIGYYVRILLNTLRKGKLRAEQRERSMIESLVRVGHEVRTPLHAMLVICDLIDNEEIGREQSVRLNRLRGAIDGLARLGKDMIDVARVYAGIGYEHRAVCDLQTTVAKSSITYADSAIRKGLDFSIELALDQPTTFCFDKLRLEQLLRNLLSNAIRCTNSGSVRVRSVIHKVKEGAYRSSIEVIDTGAGVPTERTQDIFSESHAATNVGTSAYFGAGLGLAISRDLAVGLGGNLDLRTAPGRGSSFEVTFPVLSIEGGGEDDDGVISFAFFGHDEEFVDRVSMFPGVRTARISGPAEFYDGDVRRTWMLVMNECDIRTWFDRGGGRQGKLHSVLIIRPCHEVTLKDWA